MIDETLLQNILIAALLAFSVQVALRSGIFSLAGVGTYAIGSYAAAILVKHGMVTALAMLVAVLLAGAVSYALAWLLVRLRDLYLAMATVSFDLMVGVIALNWTGLTGGSLGLFAIPVSVTTTALAVTVVIVALLLVLMEHGTIGRALQTIREDEELAQTFAVDTRSYRRLAFVVSGMLGALAGCFHALLFNSITPGDAGFDLIVLALTMVIIGGFGSWVGALIGAILLTWLPVKLASIGEWWNAVYGGVLILVATFVPGGLYGVLRELGRAGVRWRRA